MADAQGVVHNNNIEVDTRATEALAMEALSRKRARVDDEVSLYGMITLVVLGSTAHAFMYRGHQGLKLSKM